MKLVRIRFRSPFRIGHENYVDAITLYRAFIAVYSMIGEDFSEILNGNLKYSSIFPIIKNTPLFYSPPKKVKCSDRKVEKSLKGSAFITKEVLDEVVKSGEFNVQCIQDNNGRVSEEKVMVNGKEFEFHEGVIGLKDKEVNVRPLNVTEYKNRMDRVTSGSDIYTQTETMYLSEMYFLTTSQDSKKMERAVRLLGQLGIGGKRNLGYGKFDLIGIEDFSLNINGKYKYLTGRGLPSDSNFIAGGFDRVTGISSPPGYVTTLPLLILLPVGSLAKGIRRTILGYDENSNPPWKENLTSSKNILIIDPILL